MRDDIEKALQLSSGAFFMDSADKGIEAFSVRTFLTYLNQYENQEWTEKVANNLAQQFAARANQQNQQEVADNIKRQIGVDIEQFVFGGGKVAQRLEGLTLANVQLIKSIPTQYLDKVQSAVTRGLASGKLTKEIAAEIKEIGGVTDSRARLIARDQSSKANSALTQARHEELGITKYRWSTSGDERVRESHMANDGKIFSYDDPPPTGHPGDEINCRCVAIAIFDGVNDTPDVRGERSSEVAALVSKGAYAAILSHTRQLSGFARKEYGLSFVETEYLVAYTNTLHRDLNIALRTGTATAQQKLVASKLDKALDKMPKYQGVTYRDIRIPKKELKAFLDSYQIGSIIKERQFTSTSKIDALKDFKGNIRFIIRGKNGRDIEKISMFPQEREVLFQSEKRFIVKKVHKPSWFSFKNVITIELMEIE
ncbi:phage head morphogenesis protein [Pelistega indica]|nr:phage head morphogenesis protein [Pelistega indica]